MVAPCPSSIGHLNLPCEQGVLIALANYTLEAIVQLTLRVRGVEDVTLVESVHHGAISFEQSGVGEILVTLPLDANDWVKITCAHGS